MTEDLFNYQNTNRPYSEPTTSKEAARSIGEASFRMAQQVLDRIRTRPSTCEEVEQATGMSHQTVSARIRYLVLDGKLENSGDKRFTSSGRRAIVWRIK